MKNIPPRILAFAESLAEKPEKGFSPPQFLDHTQDLSIPPAERLRLLGIALEAEYVTPHIRHWQLLDDVYNAAISLASDDPFIYQSKGISATELSLDPDVPPPFKRDLFEVAREAFQRAIRLDEKEGDFWYTLGNLYYFHDQLTEAQQCYQAALERSPDHYLARMYLGHCYFDQQEWQEALGCFFDVDREKLQKYQPAWRDVKLAELIGVCLARLGQEKAAEPWFDEVLDAYKKTDWETLPNPLEMKNFLPKIRWARWLKELP